MSSSDLDQKLKNLIENDETENFYTILSEIIENNKENFSSLAQYLNEVFKLIIEEIDESNCEKKLSFICLFFEILISENIDFSNYLQNILVIIEENGINSDENIKRLINICNNATINKKDLFNYLIQFSRNKTEYLYILYSLDGFKEIIVETISYNWELIEELLDNQEIKSNINNLKNVLKCLEILIETSGIEFKEYASSALYKTLDYLSEIDDELQNRSLMIIYNLAKYCNEQLEPLKEKIIEFLKVLKNSSNNPENINLCNILLNHFYGENKENEENVNNDNNNINTNKEIINENINNNNNNQTINEKENYNNPVKDEIINENNNNNNEIISENDFNKINEQNYINDQNIEDIKIEEEISKKERENKEYNIQNEVAKEYDDKKELEIYDKEENSDNNEIINNDDDNNEDEENNNENNEEENNNENNEEENNNEHNEEENNSDHNEEENNNEPNESEINNEPNESEINNEHNEEENNNEHNESEINNEHNESENNNEYNKEENNSENSKEEYNNKYNKEEYNYNKGDYNNKYNKEDYNTNKYNKEENNSEEEEEVINDEKYNHLKNLIKKEDNYKMELKSSMNKNKKFNLNEIVMKIKDLSDKQIIILETIEQYKRDTKRIINQKKSKISSLEAKVEELKEEIRIEKNKKRNRIGKTNNQMRRKKVNNNNFDNENDIDNDYNDYHY